jgi:hypothetical protein
MIDKADFYHGAALAMALDDARCIELARYPRGYLVNDNILALIKYTTKNHSPWQFSFSTEDVARLQHCPDGVSRVVLALVCAGDGICAISAGVARALLEDAAAWIRVRRRFRGWYGVSGPAGILETKVALKRWPEILFQDEENLDEQKNVTPD